MKDCAVLANRVRLPLTDLARAVDLVRNRTDFTVIEFKVVTDGNYVHLYPFNSNQLPAFLQAFRD